MTSPRRRALLRPLTAGLAVVAVLTTTAGTAAAEGPPLPGRASVTAGAAAALGSTVGRAIAGSTARTVSAAVEVDGLGAVYRRDAGHPLPPASTQKTYTASAALLALPAGARSRTEVAATAAVSVATPTVGTLPGALWLVAGGDPYLTSTGLRQLARDVRAAGITSVTGGIRLDDSRYDGVRRNVGWKTSFVPGQSGPLSALALDRNRWRRDAAFLRDPALPAAVRFRDLLRAEGVSVQGSVVRARRPQTARTVAERLSAPLPSVVTRILKESDNFAAELLLKEVGRVVRGDGSSAGGVAAVRSVLAARGVTVGTSTDGSGLSSRNRQTPAGQLALLSAMAGTPVAGDLRSALPRACVDGTLRRRMCGTAAAGNATAKTGTLSGVTTLAGYVRTRSGRTARFAFQLTGVRSSAAGRAAMDRAVVALANSWA